MQSVTRDTWQFPSTTTWKEPKNRNIDNEVSGYSTIFSGTWIGHPRIYRHLYYRKCRNTSRLDWPDHKQMALTSNSNPPSSLRNNNTPYIREEPETAAANLIEGRLSFVPWAGVEHFHRRSIARTYLEEANASWLRRRRHNGCAVGKELCWWLQSNDLVNTRFSFKIYHQLLQLFENDE